MAGWWLAIALGSAAGTWLARGYALRRALIDQPGERRSHREATPRGGGIGLVVVLIPSLLGLGILAPASALPATLGLVLVAGIGWWDDHRPLSAALRFAVHVAAGALAAAAAGAWGAGPVEGLAVTLFTASLVNIWNFMDGIDGIATLQAIVVALAAALLLPAPAALVAGCLAAACAGFLPFNFPRARIFLGDVGSGALGYMLALIVATGRGGGADPILLVAFPLAVFLVDAGLTLARRAVRGERWWTPHTQHLYQGLARRWAHPAVTLAYAAAATGGVAWAVVLRDGREAYIIPSLSLWYIACAAAWVALQRIAAGRGAPVEKDRR